MEIKALRCVKRENAEYTGYIDYLCPSCGQLLLTHKIGRDLISNELKYCPKCGCRVEVGDSE